MLHPLRTTETRESGFTLIEVLIAMMVFGIISVLVAYSLTLSMTLTRSSRANEVAANLAAQQVDIARSAKDVFSVVSGTVTQTIDGTQYTITKIAGWVTSTGTVADCGTSQGILQNKTLNVSVSWGGMRPGTKPVQASTLLAPAGPVNDPASGTILVHVTNASGAGVANIPITAKPDATITPNTAATITPGPPSTDADGCSYALKVTPGAYTVTVGKAGDGSISNSQVQVPTVKVSVVAGQSAVVEMQYDKAATPALTIATAGTLIPISLPMTYVPQSDPYTTVPTVTGVTATTPLFPFGSGYAVFAGAFMSSGGSKPTCLSVDPQQWTQMNASGHVGARAQAIPTPSGPSVATVTMPVVTVAVSGKFLVAQSAVAASTVGDPGCATGMTLYFPKSSGNSATIALPYGTWVLYALSNSGDPLTALVDVSKITRPVGSPPATSANIFTLDPRLP
ncbi:prepilin-type N-terminal cleavage/methylation domain-containing protein [Leifsonia sp. NCR5]|uniref:prepilin-type N-terminal cleavage/methylation domain-containing protein n=1 Tax=Leifsonia sp. NCR5 TaxID=1978342 RepID=UPI000A19A92E|nr:prepilin-type N-terminal cleavage/methylation domain-containing protein [Leifsonia sp. NCR5]